MAIRKPRVDKEIPTSAIESIVGRFHVGTPDQEILDRITMLTGNCANLGWTPAKILQAQRYAIWCHRKNQQLYTAVMSGRLS